MYATILLPIDYSRKKNKILFPHLPLPPLMYTLGTDLLQVSDDIEFIVLKK